MNLLNKKGVISLSQTLEERHVLDIVLGRAVSGDDSPISADGLSKSIGISKAECQHALKGLCDRGVIERSSRDTNDWDSATFKVTAYRIVVEADQLSLNMEEESPVEAKKAKKPAKPKSPPLEVVSIDEKASDMRRTEIGDRAYWTDVRLANDRGDGALLMIGWKLLDDKNGELELVVDGKPFADVASAWAFADEYLKGLQP